jgi:hypothetical protein
VGAGGLAARQGRTRPHAMLARADPRSTACSARSRSCAT